jgi:hypothetical protein
MDSQLELDQILVCGEELAEKGFFTRGVIPDRNLANHLDREALHTIDSPRQTEP